jgi:hypothetical protein
MEALLEKEETVESWNDERLDELSRRIDKTATKEEATIIRNGMTRGFDRADHEFARVNDRLDKLFYGLSFFGLTLVLNLAADKL